MMRLFVNKIGISAKGRKMIDALRISQNPETLAAEGLSPDMQQALLDGL